MTMRDITLGGERVSRERQRAAMASVDSRGHGVHKLGAPFTAEQIEWINKDGTFDNEWEQHREKKRLSKKESK